MNTTPDFIFNRTLTDDELKFWSNFFDKFPFHRQAYTQALISLFSKNLSESIDLDETYRAIQGFQAKEELINHFFKDNNEYTQFNENYPLIINKLDEFFPNSEPVQLFLMSLYGGCIQNMNFEISANGVHVLPTDRTIKICTYVPELAFIVDFMGNRANEIFPHLKLEPIKVSGEVNLKEKKGDGEYLIKIEKNTVKRFIIEDKSLNFEFGYDFSQNSEDRHDRYAPLQYEQTRLLRAIQDSYLRKALDINEPKNTNKNKI